MAFDLACPADLSVLRIEGVDTDVRWSEVVDHAGGVDKDGGGTEPVSTFVTEVVEDAVYIILKDVQFGDGANSLTFKSFGEMVYFIDNQVPVVKANAILQLGELSNNYPINGSCWNWKPVGHDSVVNSNGEIDVYDSLLICRDVVGYAQLFQGTANFKNAIFNGVEKKVMPRFYSTISFDSVYFCNIKMLELDATPLTFNNVHVHHTVVGAYFVAEAECEGIKITDASGYEVSILNVTAGLIDPNFDLSTVQIINAAGILIRRQTCNIHVADKNGADLASVDVDCEHAHLVEGSDSKAYKCIQDHTAVDATHKPITGTNWNEYWELYDASGGLGGDWNTGFDYKAGATEFATATTDANGNITEQVIDCKIWTGTSEIRGVRIHKFTFTHVDYPDFVMNDVIVDHPLIWEFDMGQSTSDLTSIVQGAIENNSLDKAAKLLVNKAVQNKSTGAINYYDDDGQTVILTHTPTDGESEITRTPS